MKNVIRKETNELNEEVKNSIKAQKTYVFIFSWYTVVSEGWWYSGCNRKKKDFKTMFLGQSFQRSLPMEIVERLLINCYMKDIS